MSLPIPAILLIIQTTTKVLFPIIINEANIRYIHMHYRKTSKVINEGGGAKLIYLQKRPAQSIQNNTILILVL
jgi:hypothetical protein